MGVPPVWPGHGWGIAGGKFLKCPGHCRQSGCTRARPVPTGIITGLWRGSSRPFESSLLLLWSVHRRRWLLGEELKSLWLALGDVNGCVDLAPHVQEKPGDRTEIEGGGECPAQSIL